SCSKSLFSPTYVETIFLTWRFSSRTPMPKPSTPALFETIVRFFAPLRCTAAMRFSGMPHRPKPPIRTVMPSLRLAMAASGEEMRLSMCKSLQCRSATGEQCVCSALIWPPWPKRLAHQFQDGLSFGVEGVFTIAFNVYRANDNLFCRIEDRDDDFGTSR